MDFEAQIRATLDTSQAKSALESFKASIKNETIKIKLDVDSPKLKIDEGKLKIKPSIDTSGIDSAKTKIKNSISEQKIQFKIDTGQTLSDIAKIEAKLKNLGQSEYLKTKEFNNAFSTLEKFKNVKLDSNNINQYNTALKTCQNYLQAASADMSTMASSSQRITLKNNIQKILKENSAYTKEAKQELQSYIDEIDNLGTSMTKLDSSRISNRVKEINGEMLQQGRTGKNFLEEIGRGMKQIGQFAWTYGIIQQLPTALSNSVSELKNINDILTEISKTSDLTTSQIKQLGETSFDSASRYGKKASDYLIGVQEMSRSGFYGKQAEDLAKLSILGQAAGDMSTETSNSYLLATNAAYQYLGSVEKLNAVLDGQNMITNRNSVSMNDMAQATSEAASMAAQTGVQIDELSAMIGTMEARTKSGGSEVGNAVKAILINLQNTSSDKIVNTLDKAGASMTKYVDGVEQLRNPIEILKDLAKTYNSLEENDPLKSEILTNIGMKYHANKLSALLTGWDDYEKMLVDYSQGLGSSAIEAEKSANNWSGSVNKLSNAWTELVQNFANSDVIITATNLLTGFVNGIDNAASALGGFKSLISIIGGTFLTKNGLGKTNVNANLYKIKQNYRRFINVEKSIAV